ncbi:hypothetical protein [Bradyrhizobium elkanii]
MASKLPFDPTNSNEMRPFRLDPDQAKWAEGDQDSPSEPSFSG